MKKHINGKSWESGGDGAATPKAPRARGTHSNGLSDRESLAHDDRDLMLSRSQAQDLYLILHHAGWVNYYWAQCMLAGVHRPFSRPSRSLNAHLREMMPLVLTLERELQLFAMFSHLGGKMPPDEPIAS